MTQSLDTESLISTDIRNEEVREVLKLGHMPLAAAVRYLNIYVGSDPNWKQYLGEIFNKVKDPDKMRQLVSCAILLPAVDRSLTIDPAHPENLLFKIHAFRQLNERDWFKLFQDTFSRDVDIDAWRVMILAEGVIHPIDYAPMSRQAYNWLYEKAQNTGAVEIEGSNEISERFIRLVQVYGGAVICNIFSRHPHTIQSLVNWRTGYFFERNIFNVYKKDEIIKIKQAELQKTNKQLVKSIRII